LDNIQGVSHEKAIVVNPYIQDGEYITGFESSL